MNTRTIVLGVAAWMSGLATASAHEGTGAEVTSEARLEGPGGFPLGWSQPGSGNDVVARPLVALDLGAGVVLQGPGVTVRRSWAIDVRSEGITLAALRGTGAAALTGTPLRLVYEFAASLSGAESTQGSGLSDPPFSVCGSQSFLSLFGGLALGQNLVIGLRGSVQDDPFHFRWADLTGAGIGCLGHPGAWTSGEQASMEARLHFGGSLEVWGAIAYAQQRVTTQLTPDSWSLASGRAMQGMVGFTISG